MNITAHEYLCLFVTALLYMTQESIVTALEKLF